MPIRQSIKRSVQGHTAKVFCNWGMELGDTRRFAGLSSLAKSSLEADQRTLSYDFIGHGQIPFLAIKHKAPDQCDDAEADEQENSQDGNWRSDD